MGADDPDVQAPAPDLQGTETLRLAKQRSPPCAAAAKILCVESDSGVLESRCAILKHSGYDATAASPQLAEILLRSRKFDLIVISTVSDYDLHRVINVADGAELLVLDGLAMPTELLSLVAQRLNRVQRRA